MQDLPSLTEKRARLQLFRSRGIGPLTYQQLVNRFGSAAEALDSLPDLIADSGRRNMAVAPRAQIEEELERADQLGATLLTFGEDAYPKALAAIDDPPPALFLRGELDLLSTQTIAIVGARNASAASLSFAENLARELGSAGVTIASGMARGIDGAAHRGALASGTVAVLAGGVDSIYPPEHAALYQEISEEGLVLSEQPLGLVARAVDFPKRNRIVSGLSQGVVVVEAAERSGTLITARLAAEQGRDVFAVPGSPMDPRCRGTNALLKKGAILLQSADDVLDELAARRSQFLETDNLAFDPPTDDEDCIEPQELRQQVWGLLSFTPTHRDSIIRHLGAPTAAVATALLDLTLEGLIQEEAGGHYVLAARN